MIPKRNVKTPFTDSNFPFHCTNLPFTNRSCPVWFYVLEMAVCGFVRDRSSPDLCLVVQFEYLKIKARLDGIVLHLYTFTRYVAEVVLELE